LNTRDESEIAGETPLRRTICHSVVVSPVHRRRVTASFIFAHHSFHYHHLRSLLKKKKNNNTFIPSNCYLNGISIARLPSLPPLFLWRDFRRYHPNGFTARRQNHLEYFQGYPKAGGVSGSWIKTVSRSCSSQTSRSSWLLSKTISRSSSLAVGGDIVSFKLTTGLTTSWLSSPRGMIFFQLVKGLTTTRLTLKRAKSSMEVL
jgi:hypothetical protein